MTLQRQGCKTIFLSGKEGIFHSHTLDKVIDNNEATELTVLLLFLM